MKNPTDAVGNELLQGSLIAIKLGDQVLVGMITQLSTGGIDLASPDPTKAKQTAGMLMINISIPMPFIPESRIGQIYRLVDPNAQAVVEKMAAAPESSKVPFVMSIPGAKT